MPDDKVIRLDLSKGVILDKITSRMENAGLQDSDIMAIRAVAVYEGVNGNTALFERDDLAKAVDTFRGKPLRILFDGVNPTGHGFDRETQTFSSMVTNIGFIDWAYGDENPETGLYEIIVEIGMWQKYYPVIARRMRELHRENNLKFSLEAERDFEITSEGYRRCYNINFTGLSVVQNPAFTETRSLMVAEILEKGGLQMDELKVLLEGLKSDIGEEIAEQINTQLGTLNTTIASLKSDKEISEQLVLDLQAEIAEKDGTIKTIEAERDGFKSTVESANKEILGTERAEKLAKFGEVKETNDELAEMSKENFVDLLEKMVDSYEPEVASVNNKQLGTPYHKVVKANSDNRAKLLAMVEGFGA